MTEQNSPQAATPATEAATPASDVSYTIDEGVQALQAARAAASEKEAPQEDGREEEEVVIEDGDAPEEQPEESDDLETEEAEVEADEQEPEEEEADHTKYKVTANGEELEVTMEELLKGYSREADYTRKTMELSEKQKALQQEYEAKEAEAEVKYHKELDQFRSKIMQGLESDAAIDWETLEREDPGQYAALKVKQQERIQALEKMDAQRAEAQQREYQKVLKRERELFAEKFPEIGDPMGENSKAFREDVTSYLTEAGFNEQEIGGLSDHRTLAMIKDAVEFRKMKADSAKKAEAIKEKKVTPVPKYRKPGTSGSSASEMQRLRQQQRKNPNDLNAAVALMRAQRRGKT